MKRDDNNFQAFIDRMEMAVLADSEQVLLAGAKDDEPKEENTACNYTPGCGEKEGKKYAHIKQKNVVPGCNCPDNDSLKVVSTQPKKEK